jgi:hypothetical protein
VVADEADRDEPRGAEAAPARRAGKPRRGSRQERIGRRVKTRRATKSATRYPRFMARLPVFPPVAPMCPPVRATGPPVEDAALSMRMSLQDSTGSSTEPTTTRTISAAVKALFTDAAKAITRPNEYKPPPARRGGETEKGFIRAVRRSYDRLRETHRAVAYDRAGKASGDEAAEKALLEAQMPDDWFYAGGGYYGEDLFDPASAYWQGNNANDNQWYDEDFSARRDQYFPQP